jgi:SAM-dependent methyltransferase
MPVGRVEDPADSARTAFNAEQFANPYPDGIEHHYWMLARNALVLRALRTQMPSSGLVIDVGCGRGITVEYLRRHGVNAIGVDTGIPRPIVPAVQPFLQLGQDARGLPPELRRDVRGLLLLDVLEHVPEPAVFLASLAEAFDACAAVVITVPARQELWSNYDEYYRHYRRYSLESARRLFPTDLFQLTGARYAFRLLYPPALALAFMRRGRPVSVQAPLPRARAMHRLAAGYFRLESAVLPWWVGGTSLMLTLRRRW